MKLRIYIDTNIYINSILNRDNDISIINLYYIMQQYIKEITIKLKKTICQI